MKAVLFCQSLAPQSGGAAFSESSLCSSLQRQVTTVVFCPRGAVDKDFVAGFGLTDVKEYRAWEMFRAWRDPAHWISRVLDDADVVHINGHWRWEYFVLAAICKRKTIPYLLQPRGMLWVGHRKIFLKKIFNALIGNYIVRNASRLIALSRFETEQWKPYAVATEKMVVLPNGVNVNGTSSQAGGKRIFLAPYYLYLGRIESRKNLVFFVEAFAQYVRDGGVADLRLMGPPERGYDRVLNRHITRLGLEQRVFLVAPLYGVSKQTVLRDAIAVVYPSVGEPFGRVPFEALSAGGVPIVPLESGSAEYLQPFLPSVLFPIQDGHALLACMRGIEHGAETDLEQRLAQARRWVVEELDWDKITASVLALYRNTLLAHATQEAADFSFYPQSTPGMEMP